MYGRFCQAYPYTAETALAMPWRRFLALYRQIDRLQAEEDLRALLVAGFGANPGERGRAFQDYAKRLELRAGIDRRKTAISSLVAGVIPMATIEAEPGSIRAELERLRAAENERQRQRTAQKTAGI